MLNRFEAPKGEARINTGAGSDTETAHRIVAQITS